MRITRTIPGIRPSTPASNEALALKSGLFSVGSTHAMVFAFILAILNIFLTCTLRGGGYLAHFWLVPRLSGLSLFSIMTAVNVLLICYACMGYIARSREGKQRNWNSRIGLVAVLVLLGGTQTLLSTWRSTALLHLDRAKEIRQGQAAAILELRSEIAGLSGHDWYGEYETSEGGWQANLLLTQNSDARFVHRLGSPDGDSVDGFELPGDMSFTTPLNTRMGRVLLGEPTRSRETVYCVVAWGPRRFLVPPERLDVFLAGEVEPNQEEGIFLRLGDEQQDLEGSPELLLVSR